MNSNHNVKKKCGGRNENRKIAYKYYVGGIKAFWGVGVVVDVLYVMEEISKNVQGEEIIYMMTLIRAK